MPVWTTTDPTNCPILSYTLQVSSGSAISYLLCDGLTSNRNSGNNDGVVYNTNNGNAPTDLADCQSKCVALSICNVVAYYSANRACHTYRASGLGTCEANANYKTYSAYDDLRKVVVSTATAGTFNAIFEVTAKGGATAEKTVAITVKTCT